MSTPIHDKLAARMELALAPAVKPERTLYLGTFSIWCVVCEEEDFMHEHPEDPRSPRIGDEATRPTRSEAAWINQQRAGGLFAQAYSGPFRPDSAKDAS